MPVPEVMSADFARDTVEAFLAERASARPWIYWIFLLGAAAALSALPVVEVDIAVNAPGIVRAASGRRELRSPVSGTIAELRVHEGSRVATEEVLAILHSDDLAERLARNAARQRASGELIHDLDLLAAAAPPDGSTANTAPEGLATAALRQEFAQFRVQLEANRLAESRARGDVERMAVLAARGIASPQELDNARYQLDQARATGTLLVEQNRTRWQAQRRQENEARDELASEARRLEDERSRYTLRAPASGVVLDLPSLGVGSFVSAGQNLGTLSPDEHLVIEALVASRDAGLVHPGQPARIQVDAYPAAQWGRLDGHVERISADAIAGAATPLFRATIRPGQNVLHLPNGVRGELKKGLTVNTRLVIGRRSLWQLLSGRVSDSIDPRQGQRSSPAASTPPILSDNSVGKKQKYYHE